MQSLIVRKLVNPSNLLKNYNPVIREITCQPKKGPLYRIRFAIPTDYSQVVSFMQETYMKTEPSIINIGLEEKGPSCPSLVYHMHQHVRAGMTLIAEDRLGYIVGAAVNLDSRCESLKPPDYFYKRYLCDTNSCECPLVAQLFDFFNFVSREPDLWSKYCVTNVFECAHVAVHPEHQGQGIARRLILESWLLARDMAYRAFRIDCSNVYTASIAKSFGWECVYSLPFSRYFANGDFVFKCVKEPHTEMQVYADQVKYFDSYYPPCVKQQKPA